MSCTAQEYPQPLNRRELAWLARWRELAAFLDEHERVPHESDAARERERSLAGWLRYQRRRAQRGVMPPWQRALLQQAPLFEWDPAADRWWAQHSQLKRFLETERRMPRYRTTDEAERAIAAWVHKQRYFYRRGQLGAYRVEALRRLPFRIV